MSWTSMLMATAVASADPDLTDEDHDSSEITEACAREIRMVIREQIVCFRKRDWRKALSLSSQGIRETFTTPRALGDLVESRYAMLLDPRQLVFGEFSITPEGIGLYLEVVDRDLQRHHVLYLLTRERRAGWRVNGCLVRPVDQAAEAA